MYDPELPVGLSEIRDFYSRRSFTYLVLCKMHRSIYGDYASAVYFIMGKYTSVHMCAFNTHYLHQV